MKWVIAILLVFIGLLQYRLWFGEGSVREFHRLTAYIAEQRQEADRRRDRNTALEAEVMDLKQGLDAVEERARQDLGMVKEGEAFVQVIDPRHEPEALPSPPDGKTATGKTEAAQEKPVQRKPKEAKPPTESQAASGPAKPKAAETKTVKPGPAKPSKPKQPPKSVKEKPAEQEPAEPVIPVDEPD